MLILIVDDDDRFRTQLEEWLQDNFMEEGILVEAAATVEEGQKKLCAFHQRGRGLDAVILDAKLPTKIGEHDAVDLSLTSVVHEKFPEALLVIYSSYVGVDAQVSPLSLLLGVDRVINKQTHKSGEELVQVLREYPLLKRLETIFGGAHGHGHWAKYSSGSHHCVSWGLHTLVADILKVYNKLSPDTQKRIREHIPIEKDEQGKPLVKFYNTGAMPGARRA